ncbi:hypothetical protein MRB53_035209 [Persea americana]|uniref:Uncharacterized protein n=1 Tax=Persea americana TaxID=3435 RepID=A0ACC2K401_PERAE|nr:hypothetical protein MRB53_035209 [Persea americana]
MENQDEEFYLNLPRKELQALCKKHGLSANKTNFLLARSLFFFFKEKDRSSTFSKEKLSGPVDLPMADLQPEEPFNSLEETDKVHKRRVEASDADSYGPSSSKEEEAHDKRHFQPVKQKEINCVEADTSDKVANTAANTAHRGSANIETTEGFSCSISTTQNDIQPAAPSHLQLQEIISHSKVLSQLNDHTMEYRKNDHPGSLNLRNSDLHLQNPSNKGCMPQIQCMKKTIGACTAESGLVSSSETSTEPRPSSFQFFVRSEEGINLYVDLNSGPSDWIKVLKDEVCMYQKVHHNKSRVLHEELKGLGEIGERAKSSFMGYLETGFQNKEDERNDDSQHIKSSPSSLERENCHSMQSQKDVADNLFRSAITTKSIPGVERPLEGDGQVVSNVCKPDSSLQNQMDSSNLSCPKHSKTVPQDSLVAASKVDDGSVSVSNNSLNECGHGMDANFNLDEPKCRDLLEVQTLKTASVHHLVDEASRKHSLTMSDEFHEDSCLPDVIHHENSTGIGEGSQGSGHTVMQLSSVQVHHHEKRGGLLDHQLHQETCDGHDTPDIGNQTHTFPGEQGQSTAANLAESSENSQFDNSLDTTNKRSHSLEFPEEIQNKRQRSSAENQNNAHTKPMEKNLRSGKNLAKEQLLPRRSKRLESK